MFPALLAAESLNTGALIAIVAIVCGITLTAIIIVFGLKYSMRRQELWHETARIALEKGQPLPPNMEDEHVRSESKRNKSDFREGLILVAVGAGLYLFLGSFVAHNLGYVGFIPGFIGVALLLHGTLKHFLGDKGVSSSDQTPRS